MVQHEPHALLRISLLRAEHALNSSVLLFIDWSSSPDGGGRLVRVEVRMVRVVSALLKEDFADEKLARRNLDEATLQRHVIVASHFCVFACFLGSSDVREAILVVEESIDSGNLSTSHTVHKGDAAGKTSLGIFLDRTEAFLHGTMNLFWG